jgi:hypothetical protein
MRSIQEWDEKIASGEILMDNPAFAQIRGATRKARGQSCASRGQEAEKIYFAQDTPVLQVSKNTYLSFLTSTSTRLKKVTYDHRLYMTHFPWLPMPVAQCFYRSIFL